MGIDRKAMSQQTAKRTEESYAKKDDSGRFASIFKKELGDLPFWKCKEGSHELDIIPFNIGENNPLVVRGEAQVGDSDYVLDIWVHRSIGPTEDNYICPARNYGKPCPICEKIKILQSDEANDDLVKDIRPRRRVIYNILCWDKGEFEKGIQIWEVAHFYMESHLVEIAKQPRDGGFVNFACPDDGKTVCFKREGSGGQNTKFTGHQFADRIIDNKPYTITDKQLAQAFCLDDLVEVKTYEELEQAFYGTATGRSDSPQEEEPDVEMSAEEIEDLCPAKGGVFGETTGQLKPCDNCEHFEACQEEYDKREKEGVPKEEEPIRRRRRG